jgi:thiol-disulfide isomerase/thioredoxin
VIAVEVLSGSSSGDRKAAPALPRADLVPPTVNLADLRGHPAAINFWASWCGPCRQEGPQIAALSRSLPKGARLVGVDFSDALGGARGYVHQYGWRFPVLRDPDGTVGDAYGVHGLPTTVVLDRQGRIAQVLRGPQHAATIRSALRAAGQS